MQFRSHLLFWYALSVRPRHEKVVAESLKHKGYEGFLPLYRSANRTGRTGQGAELPLFPGYVFCRFAAQERLPILTTPSVMSILGNGKNLLPIDEQEMETVHRVVQARLNPQPWPYLAHGDLVRVDEGPLRGVYGLVQQCKGQDRLVLSVSLLQRAISVEINRSHVCPVTSDHDRRMMEQVARG